MGQGKEIRLSKEDFSIIQETWATNYPIFDQMLVAYTQYAKKLRKNSKHTPIPSMKYWTIPSKLRARWTKQEFKTALLMKTMSQNCLVHHTTYTHTQHTHTVHLYALLPNS